MKKILPFIFLTFSLVSAQEITSVDHALSFNTDHVKSVDIYKNNDVTINQVSNIVINEEEFTSEVLQKHLEELRLKTPFQVEYNATVERHIRLYLDERKEVLSNLMDKANFYFPIFEELLDKYELPLELKYLAVVESALEPKARSVAGAKGIWQFMYHTGLENGLTVNSLVDDRMDPVKSTEAACKYLKKLYDTFEDWDLVLAAYNSGPGNVSKAIKRSGGLRNYWNIRQFLPTETRGYLPAFYATFYLFEYNTVHQIYPKNIGITYFDTDTIHVNNRVSFTKIKQEINIDEQLLADLNPQYKQGVIPHVKGKNFTLRLPKYLINDFLQKENIIYGLPETENPKREKATYIIPTATNSYIVKAGDNLNSIAKNFNITVEQLKKWNGLHTDYLIANQRLVVTDSKLADKNINQVSDFTTYVVKEGDSLFMISKKYPNVTINQLRSWNNLWNKNYIEPGTELKILTDSE